MACAGEPTWKRPWSEARSPFNVIAWPMNVRFMNAPTFLEKLDCVRNDEIAPRPLIVFIRCLCWIVRDAELSLTRPTRKTWLGGLGQLDNGRC
jgi:hypothetical protein